MYLSSHMRVGAMAVATLLIGGYLLFGGSLGGDMVVQLDFGMYPEVFEGCQVEINGEVVGQLEVYGQTARSGFKVGRGEHKIRVLHPEYGSQQVMVQMDTPGQKTRLVLDLEERYDRTSESSHMLITIGI